MRFKKCMAIYPNNSCILKNKTSQFYQNKEYTYSFLLLFWTLWSKSHKKAVFKKIFESLMVEAITPNTASLWFMHRWISTSAAKLKEVFPEFIEVHPVFLVDPPCMHFAINHVLNNSLVYRPSVAAISSFWNRFSKHIPHVKFSQFNV